MNDMTRMNVMEAPARLTIDEFMQIVGTGVFDGWKVELADGEIVRMSPATMPHVRLLHVLHQEFIEIFPRGSEWIVVREATVRIGERTLRDIDLAVMRPFGPDDEFTAPASVLLACEVSASSLRYDLGPKAADYARGGIAHYWVFDVERRLVHLMSKPLDGEYGEKRMLPFGDPLPVPGTDRTITIE